MHVRDYIYIASFSALISFGCKKSYTPSIVSSGVSYLVVEGVISAGGDSTIIKLSRTIPVGTKDTVRHETGATVIIVDDQGTTYPVLEADSGRYTAAPLAVDTTRRYKLNIVAGGKTYASDLVPVKVTPPMDTVAYDINANGVNIYASTHDATGRARYYRWDYMETYIFKSNVEAPYIFDNSYYAISNKFRLRTPAQQIHVCYDTQNASTIVLASTTNLSRDVVYNVPITQVSSASEKLYYRYSILVKQYALTPEAYNFWLHIKKNTEQIGSIFDAQPSEIQGNIHCTSNQSELVVGYISACTISQKRIFIDRQVIPWTYPEMNDKCTDTTLAWDDGNIPPEIRTGIWVPFLQLHSGYNPVDRDSVYSVKLAYYDCSDCRFHNHGSTIKPAFWK